MVGADARLILASASVYQAKASGTRLGGKPSTTGGAGLPKFKSLSKTQAVKNERATKRQEVSHMETGIRISGTLWKADEGGKMTQVSSTL